MDFSIFDTRNYETVSVTDGYTEWSTQYNDAIFKEMTLDLFERTKQIPWQSVHKALDFACGTGRMGPYLKEKGIKQLHGVDITPAMIDLAGERNVYSTLMLSDIRNTSWDPASFDLITNVLSDEHFEDLTPVYEEAHRLLKKGGHYCNLSYHPHFMLLGIPPHFNREPGKSIAIESFVQLFSDHFAAAAKFGLRLKDLHERVVPESWIERKESWRKHLNRPISYLMVWEKT